MIAFHLYAVKHNILSILCFRLTDDYDSLRANHDSLKEAHKNVRGEYEAKLKIMKVQMVSNFYVGL